MVSARGRREVPVWAAVAVTVLVLVEGSAWGLYALLEWSFRRFVLDDQHLARVEAMRTQVAVASGTWAALHFEIGRAHV